jgi:hypothetical protein
VERRAFTLLEAIVCLSVGSLLLAILLPALSHARAASRRVECLSNLRSFGIAVTVYRADHDNLFPDAPPVYDLPKGRTALLVALDSYLGTEVRPRILPDGRVSTPPPFRCPADAAWAAARGMSYFYDVGLAIQIAREVELDPNPVHTVSNLWINRDSDWLLSDIPESLLAKSKDPRPWHPRAGAVPRNAVYLGGHADWMKYDSH